MKLQAYIDAFGSLPQDIKQGEAQLEMQTQKSVTIENAAIKTTESFDKRVLYVRATGQNTGSAYTEDASEDPVSVMRRAVESARLVTTTRQVSFTPSGLTYPTYPKGAEIVPTFDQMYDAAVSIEKKALSLCEDAKLVNCTLSYTRYLDEVANSLGLAEYSECGYYSLDFQVISTVNGSMGEKSLTLLSDRIDGFSLEEPVRDALMIARMQASPVPVSTRKYDIVLSRYTTHDFLFMLWRSMSALQNRQAGSAFGGKEGEKIGAACVNIISSGAHPGCPIRYRMDNEGMPVSSVNLMDRGVFQTFMHNRSTAQEKGIPSTGNAGRRISFAPTIPVNVQVAPKILYVQENDRCDANLVEQVKDGIIITTILDAFHGIDYSSGEFSVPVMGMIVKDGKVTAGTTGLVWTGNMRDVLNQTHAVGRDIYFNCFRHSFTLGGPDMLVRNQAIASSD